MIACVPTVSVLVEMEQRPAARVQLASALVPSLKATVPVALEGSIVAVKVTETPEFEGFALEVTVVVEDAFPTLWERAAETLPSRSVSPAYSLVSTDFAQLRRAMELITPGLVFVSDKKPFAKALAALGVEARGGCVEFALLEDVECGHDSGQEEQGERDNQLLHGWGFNHGRHGTHGRRGFAGPDSTEVCFRVFGVFRGSHDRIGPGKHLRAAPGSANFAGNRPPENPLSPAAPEPSARPSTLTPIPS